MISGLGRPVCDLEPNVMGYGSESKLFLRFQAKGSYYVLVPIPWFINGIIYYYLVYFLLQIYSATNKIIKPISSNSKSLCFNLQILNCKQT